MIIRFTHYSFPFPPWYSHWRKKEKKEANKTSGDSPPSPRHGDTKGYIGRTAEWVGRAKERRNRLPGVYVPKKVPTKELKREKKGKSRMLPLSPPFILFLPKKIHSGGGPLVFFHFILLPSLHPLGPPSEAPTNLMMKKKEERERKCIGLWLTAGKRSAGGASPYAFSTKEMRLVPCVTQRIRVKEKGEKWMWVFEAQSFFRRHRMRPN